MTMEGKKELIEEQEEQVSGAGLGKQVVHCGKCGSEDVLVRVKKTPSGRIIIGYHCRACGYKWGRHCCRVQADIE